jgi:hypothetical protein
MTGRQITDAAHARQFILAGKATVTFKSLKTGEHLTFRVRSPKPSTSSRPSNVSHFVQLRTGGSGKSQFEYLGFLRTTDASYVHGNKSRYAPGAKEERAFMFCFGHLKQGKLPPDCEVWHEGTCGRCARKLTDPESIARGIGPECASKVGL